jgi:hypothetical protein
MGVPDSCSGLINIVDACDVNTACTERVDVNVFCARASCVWHLAFCVVIFWVCMVSVKFLFTTQRVKLQLAHTLTSMNRA